MPGERAARFTDPAGHGPALPGRHDPARQRDVVRRTIRRSRRAMPGERAARFMDHQVGTIQRGNGTPFGGSPAGSAGPCPASAQRGSWITRSARSSAATGRRSVDHPPVAPGRARRARSAVHGSRRAWPGATRSARSSAATGRRSADHPPVAPGRARRARSAVHGSRRAWPGATRSARSSAATGRRSADHPPIAPGRARRARSAVHGSPGRHDPARQRDAVRRITRR